MIKLATELKCARDKSQTNVPRSSRRRYVPRSNIVDKEERLEALKECFEKGSTQDFVYLDDLVCIKQYLIENLVSTIDEGKVYLSKDCPIPRSKFSHFSSSTGKKITRTIKLDKANYVIVPQDAVRSVGYVMSSHATDVLIVNEYQHDDTSDLLCIYDYWDKKFIKSHYGKYGYPFSTKDIYRLDKFAVGINLVKELLTIYTEHKDKNIKFVLSNPVTEQMTKLDLVLDAEAYYNISDMLGSADIDSRRMGIELMANCNLDESAGIFLLLLAEYFYDIAETPTSRQVEYNCAFEYIQSKYSSIFDYFWRYYMRNSSALDLNTIIHGLIPHLVKLKQPEVLKVLSDKMSDLLRRETDNHSINLIVTTHD